MSEEIKTGVYLCSGCGIGDALDLDQLVKVASDENNIPVCKVNNWLCNKESIASIKRDIEEEGLNRIVIGACTQRQQQNTFKFNSGLLADRVSLRENVVWTHKPNDEDTQMLAEDYLRMGIAKVKNSEPPVPLKKDINETIMVVGGGLAGMTSALAAANAGFSVKLTEKENRLGGWLNSCYKIPPTHAPYQDPEESGIDEMISEVESNNNIEVLKNCRIQKISGEPGNFKVVIKLNESQSQTFTIGAIVQATGAKDYDPNNLGDLGYGKSNNVVTSSQLEDHFKNGTEIGSGQDIKSIVFVQCAGSRDEKHLPYCSSICCANSLKQALYVREKYPEALIYIIYKDMRTSAEMELFFKRVQNDDKIFLTKGDVVNVEETENGKINVDVDNTFLGDKIQLSSDLVVLATGMVPSTLVGNLESSDPDGEEESTLDGKKAAASAEVGARILNLAYRQGTDLPTLKYGFPDSHYICFPYETRRTGIYAAGAVRSPMDITESKTDAYGAALKAIQFLHAAKEGKAVHPRSGDESYPEFYLQRCTQCKRCTEECPFGTLDEDEKGTPLFNLERCRRCGICLGACPERIISFKDYSVNMVASMIKSVEIPDEEEEKPRILAFLCENDAYPSLDIASKLRYQYDPNIRVVPVRCLGSVNTVWIADALSRGFDGILLIGCKYGDDTQCHFIKGSELANKRMANVQKKLEQLFLEPERVQLLTLSIDEFQHLPEILNNFAEEIGEMELNPYKGM